MFRSISRMQYLLCALTILGRIGVESLLHETKNKLLITEYEWKYLDYVWESQEQKNYYISKNLYRPKAMLPIDVDRSADGRTFVTVIRSPGVPASLHTVSDKMGDSGPLLIPYPDWPTYENPEECTGIIGVFRVAIDECNRLWVLDTGKIDGNYVCPAQILIYDLSTDLLISKIEIPDNIASNQDGIGLLITPIVETHGIECQKTTVYVNDVTGNGLIVWDQEKLIRYENKLFDPEEEYSNFTIAGEMFNLSDGIFNPALTPKQYSHGNRFLFFRPLASRSMYAVSVNDLKSRNPNAIRYYGSINVLSSQASAMAFSSDGTLFYGLTEDIAIGCWNLKNPLRSENLGISLIDEQRLQFMSGLKIIQSQQQNGKRKERLLIMTNRIQKFYRDTQNFSEINFRILSIGVRELVDNTVCDCF